MKKQTIIGLVFSVLLIAVITAFGFSHERDHSTKAKPAQEHVVFAFIDAPAPMFDFTPGVITLPYSVGFTKHPTFKACGFKGVSINDCLKIPIQNC
jgi:hypothetical protein